MDIVSPAPWLCEMEAEDPMLFHEFCHEYYGEDIATMLGDFNPQPAISIESKASSSLSDLAPTTHPLPISTTTTEGSTPSVFTFGQNSTEPKDNHRSSLLGTNGCQKEDASSSSDMDLWSAVVTPHGSSAHDVNQDQSQSKDVLPRKRRASRPPAQSRDHIMAERKRREKISERFIALSALVPGLKKERNNEAAMNVQTDKTSVLGEAIKHMKHLQERLKTLEEESSKRSVESVVIVKKSEIVADDDGTSSGCCSNDTLPEIEAKFSDRNVLMKIHCERQKGGVVRVLSEIEKLQLSILNVHATPFTDSTLDLTVVAQMDKVFDMTPQAVIRGLHTALVHL